MESNLSDQSDNIFIKMYTNKAFSRVGTLVGLLYVVANRF